MKTYWNYTEKERSEMTSEKVQSLLDYELMEKGVIKPVAPELLPVEMPDIPKRTVWVIKANSYHAIAAYDKADDARSAMDSLLVIETQQIGGNYQSTVAKVPLKVECEEIIDAGLYAQSKSKCDEAAAAKKANDAALKDYNDACEASREAVEGVWEDYRACQCKAHRFQNIIDTRNEYLKLCEGNEKVAASFLAKAYSPDEIVDAIAWFNGESVVTRRDPIAVSDESEVEDAELAAV